MINKLQTFFMRVDHRCSSGISALSFIGPSPKVLVLVSELIIEPLKRKVFQHSSKETSFCIEFQELICLKFLIVGTYFRQSMERSSFSFDIGSSSSSWQQHLQQQFVQFRSESFAKVFFCCFQKNASFTFFEQIET